MTDLSRVGEVRRFVHQLGMSVRLNEVTQSRLATAVNELGNNLIKYAVLGQLIIRKIDTGDDRGVEIVSIDRGPGMDSGQAIADGYTTGSTPGTGLGAVRRLASFFDIYSSVSKGTVIVCGVTENPDKLPTRRFRVGAVNLPMTSEIVSGDDWCLHQLEEKISAMVIDGLGHGTFANAASGEAVNVFRESEFEPLDKLIIRIHGRLKSTRGGAVFMVHVDGNDLSYIGAGNIRAIIYKQNKIKSLISQNGTAGVQIRRTPVMHEMWDDGLLILHSDGITSRWDLNEYPGILTKHPTIVAAVVARDFTRGCDDTCVVVIGKSV
tara:strand:- start:6384 stop:7349 length:966 start_codon:yes stop_codon:yes gene_type:complete